MRRDELCGEVQATLTRLPAPYEAHYGVVPTPPPEGSISTGHETERYEAARAAIAQIDAIARELNDPYIVSRVLTRNEAVSSSAIEGTHSTLDELLSSEESDGDEAKSATKQVRGYATSLEQVLPTVRELGNQVFTIDLIRSLHEAVMADDPDYQDKPGALRARVVWIGGTGNIATSTWNPPPPDDVEACLLETITYLQNDGMQSMTQGLITRMAIAHAHFEAIHPFRDGNGRVGRLLLPLMMAAEGHQPLYLSPYIEANKRAYYEALKLAQQRLEWQAIIGFLSDAVIETTNAVLTTRRALSDLRDIWMTRRQFRKGSAALRALDLLPHYPVMTVKRLASLLGVSTPQAAQAVTQLQEARILSERTGYARNRLFSAGEALAIINRPFGDEPTLPKYGEPAASGPKDQIDGPPH